MSAESTGLFRSPTFVRVAIAAVAAGLIGLYACSRSPTGYDITVAGAPYVISDAKDAVRIIAAPIVNGTVDPTRAYEPPRETHGPDGEPATTQLRLLHPGEVSVEVTPPRGDKIYHHVKVEPVSNLLWATILLLFAAILLPYGLGTAQAGQLGGAWYQLLSEAGGGYSLARVQLLIWFLPTAVLYGALSFTLHAFVQISGQLAVLLGLSGATTLLGTAASPSLTSRGAPVEPDLSDVVTDWSSHGDLSRYQYLLLSLVGATVMMAAFWRNLAMPDIPSQFLYLLAGSQGTYVATKAVKAAGLSPAPATGDTQAVTAASAAPAPAIVRAAPAGTATDDGFDIPAVKGANG